MGGGPTAAPVLGAPVPSGRHRPDPHHCGRPGHRRSARSEDLPHPRTGDGALLRALRSPTPALLAPEAVADQSVGPAARTQPEDIAGRQVGRRLGTAPSDLPEAITL
ncbi:hypothetical protein GCM10010398_19960 [Streptomyces fimbriatus]